MVGPISSDLERAIYRTVAWFSLFDYPVTVLEIFKYLYQPPQKINLLNVEQTLSESLWLKERLSFQNGFWFLKNSKNDLIKNHQARFLDAAKKFKKLKRAARYFSLFPFVRAVFACNNLAWHNTTPHSDIDLFVIVDPGTLWVSRMLLVLPFALVKKRPRIAPIPFGEGPGEGFDPFCFSFFATTDGLDFSRIILPNGDPYFAYWLVSLIPIFDRDKIQEQIFVQNKWLVKILPNSFGQSGHQSLFSKSRFVLPVGFLKKFELSVRYWQKKFLPCEIRDTANYDSSVIISDKLLKFHTNDKRIYFRDQWKKIYET